MAGKKAAKQGKQTKNDWIISVVRDDQTLVLAEGQSELPRGSFAIAGTQADSKGNVIFANSEEVSKSRFESGFSNCMALATSMIDKASTLGRNLEVDSITLKLTVNAKYGCSLLADAKIAGAIELKIKRKPMSRQS
jgi:hypothetical protein